MQEQQLPGTWERAWPGKCLGPRAALTVVFTNLSMFVRVGVGVNKRQGGMPALKGWVPQSASGPIA